LLIQETQALLSRGREGQRICERRQEIDSLVAALTLWP